MSRDGSGSLLDLQGALVYEQNVLGGLLLARSHSFPRNHAANHACSTLLSESSKLVSPLLWFCELLRLSWVTFEILSKAYRQDSQDRSLQDPRTAGLSMT